ncbi:tyrosine phosphatase [Dioszegia hungarica]|uniref:M-phase inducer phosphatase n=1 Tax=Dioszegia hungarica TaxID=4972 RepID=A0AA38H180_9TREE|nr:tyrosine phosphatase [Dioszegia hungarica]KAI9632603.1 tyrosine phosphatase [Dioszegia hungarica]
MSFSSSPIADSFPSTRYSSPNPSPTTESGDLPIEVDQSFNSSMSISESPYFSPTPNHAKYQASPLSDTLSPPPANLFGARVKRPDPVPLQRGSADLGVGLDMKRGFGRELSGNAVQARGKGMMLPPAVPDKTKRGGLPMQWSSSNEENGAKLFQPHMPRRETEPWPSPKSSTSSRNGMEIDSPANSARMDGSVIGDSPGFGSLFHDSPIAPPQQSKRRPLITESPASPSGSPSAKRTSLGSRGMEKTVSSGPMLFGSTAIRGNTLGTRRPQPYKRPMLAPVNTADTRMQSFGSADAVLYPSLPAGSAQLAPFARAMAAPMRRAYSVCDQPNVPDISEDESEYEASPSNPGGLGRPGGARQKLGGSRLATGVDGSPGVKPMRSSIAVPMVAADGASPMRKGKWASPYAGMPGFGDNEMDGKILPCHKVKEDGLVRITPDTLDSLISGQYTDKIKRYHIIDCRFDYEYAGGHIAGAINVKSMDALDELLLQEATGVYQDGMDLPVPSRSGELEDGEQVVLVFHCEFSAKRAPTFAKHLRSRDRTVNSALYPKIFYPEIYILEGGYCGFYQQQPNHCDPQGYIPMDDPRHFQRRDSDLHDFRKFARTRSFTYGETQPVAPSRSALPCPPLAFAAASAAQGRRSGPTIDEDDEHDSSPSGPSGDSGMEASPCPRVCSMGTAPIFGSAKTRTLGRMGMGRTASYAGTTFGR